MKEYNEPTICQCCKKAHYRIPYRARILMPDDVGGPGFMWECDGTNEKGEACNSTLFHKVDGKLFKKIEEAS